MSAPFLRQKNLLTILISFAVLEQSRVILSQAGRARYIVICINPTFTKMNDGTENPKYLLSLQNAQRDTTNFAVIVTVSVVLQQVLPAETYYLQFIWQIHIQRTQSHFFTLFKLHQRLISPAWINNMLCILTLSEPRPVAKWRP